MGGIIWFRLRYSNCSSDDASSALYSCACPTSIVSGVSTGSRKHPVQFVADFPVVASDQLLGQDPNFANSAFVLRYCRSSLQLMRSPLASSILPTIGGWGRERRLRARQCPLRLPPRFPVGPACSLRCTRAATSIRSHRYPKSRAAARTEPGPARRETTVLPSVSPVPRLWHSSHQRRGSKFESLRMNLRVRCTSQSRLEPKKRCAEPDNRCPLGTRRPTRALRDPGTR